MGKRDVFRGVDPEGDDGRIQPGSGETTCVFSRGYPQVGGKDGRAMFFGEQDGRYPFAASEVENAHAGSDGKLSCQFFGNAHGVWAHHGIDQKLPVVAVGKWGFHVVCFLLF